MENATLEDKKVGVGIVVLIAAAVLVWTQRAKILPPVEAAIPPTGVPRIESLSDLVPGFLPKFQTEAVIEQLQKDAVEDPALYAIHLREAQGLPPDVAQRTAHYMALTHNAELAEVYAQYDLANYNVGKDIPAQPIDPATGKWAVGTTTNPTTAQVEAFATQQWYGCQKMLLEGSGIAATPEGAEIIGQYQAGWAEVIYNPDPYEGTPLVVALNPEESIGYKAPAPAPAEEEALPAVNQAVEAATAASEAAEAHNWDEAIAQAQTALEAAKQAEIEAGIVIPSPVPNLSLVDYNASMVYGAAMQAAAAAASSPSGYASGGYEYAGDFGYGAGVF